MSKRQWPSLLLPSAFAILVWLAKAVSSVPGAWILAVMSLAVFALLTAVVSFSVRGRRDHVPLLQRPSDLVCVVGFLVFAVIAIFVDLVQAGHGPGPIDPAHSYAPQILANGFSQWVQDCDPLLGNNPAWYWIIAVFSPLLYLPFYLYATYAFLVKSNSVVFRNLAFMWGSLLAFTTLAIIVDEIWGEFPSPNIPQMLGGYLPYIVFPCFVIWRCWGEKVFP